MLDFYLSKVLTIVRTKPKLTLFSAFKMLVNRQTERSMKLTVLFMLAFCLQSLAKVYSQKITLSLKNAQLSAAFELITKQTGYRFFYNREQLQKSHPISVQLREATIEQALNVCFKEQPFTYSIINQVIVVKEKSTTATADFSSTEILPPLIDVHGKVLNERGEPVVDVTVTIKGTSNKTKTDNSGEFSLSSVDRDAVLVFTHVTMETFEVKVSGKTELAINLKTKIAALGDVTVTLNTGYQQLPKERVTGSFTQLDNKRYNEQAGTNVLDRLQYISNGVIPFSQRTGSGLNGLLVRGMSTLTYSIQKPLIIIDNFEYQGDINNINPNDVDNVSFLKDASASSIWGAKAANGVIVITTKKGHYNQKTKVDLNTNVTVFNKPDLFYQKNISSSDLIDLELYLFNQKYRFSDTLNATHPPFSPIYETLFRRKNGTISSSDSASQVDQLRGHDVRNDFNKYIYQKAVNKQYSLNIRGGSNNIAWILSGGLDQNINELNASYRRYNARFDNVYKIAKNLEVNSSVYYSQSISKSGKPAYGTISTIVGNIPVYAKLVDDNGNSSALYTKYRQGYIDTLGGGKLLDWRYFPLEDYKHVNNTVNIQDINAVIGIKYNIFRYLNFDLKYRYESQRSENKTISDLNSFYTRDLINSYSQLNRSTGVVTYKVPKGDILDLNYVSILAQNIRGQLSFNESYGKHAIVALIGGEVSETKNQGNITRTYGYNNDILTFANVDYINSYPLFITGSNFIPNPASLSKTNTRFVSFYGNAAYTYNDRYIISASLRRDASNLFGVDINDKWKPLWSTGISWIISNENFFKTELFDFLKFRLTYGHQGNVDPSKVGVTTMTFLGTNPYTSSPYGQIKNFVNPDLKWEQIAMLNAGLDFSTKNRRISGSVEFYNKRISDLYGPVTVDATFGLGSSTITKNVGNMKGHGWDIELNTININKVVKWTSNIIINSYKDKVTKYYDPTTLKPSQIVGSGSAIEGYPSMYLIAYRWAGLDPVNGDPQGYLNGQVSKDWSSITGSASSFNDIKYIGPSLPTLYGSLGNTISWKGLALTARVTYKFGYYFLRESINYTNLVGNLQGHSDYALRWQKVGDEQKTIVPSFQYPINSARDNFYKNSEVLATRGDNLRLQYVNLSYSLDRRYLNRSPFEDIRLYFVINNVGMIWKANKYGLDPDFSGLPPMRNYAIGLNVNL